MADEKSSDRIGLGFILFPISSYLSFCKRSLAAFKIPSSLFS